MLITCSPNVTAKDDDQEKVIVRVFGDVPFHRESEAHLMRMLSENGIIPPVFCR